MKDKLYSELVDKILSTSTRLIYNDIGRDECQCPFCGVYKYIKGHEFFLMRDMNHSSDCLYLLANQIQLLENEQ